MDDLDAFAYLRPALLVPADQFYDTSDEEDATLRRHCAQLLFRAGVRLRYPQETIATSILIFHRFLIEDNFSQHRERRDLILTTCLFLAGKVQETTRRLRDVINVIQMLADANKADAPSLDQAYFQWKEQIVEMEQVILRTLGFDTYCFHPYRLLVNYGRLLKCDSLLLQVAWGLLNDFLFCPLALTLPPPVLACSCLHLAGDITSTPIPSTTPDAAPWWTAFDVSEDSLYDACSCLLDLYDQIAPPVAPPVAPHVVPPVVPPVAPPDGEVGEVSEASPELLAPPTDMEVPDDAQPVRGIAAPSMEVDDLEDVKPNSGIAAPLMEVDAPVSVQPVSGPATVQDERIANGEPQTATLPASAGSGPHDTMPVD